mgnify:CR=1 FL=1
MPPRSKVDLLPDDVRSELESRLIRGGFSGYRDLSDWLSDEGFEISKSRLHAWGQDFEHRLGALRKVTAQARAIVAESPDDDGAVNDALIRMTQEKVFALMVELDVEMTAGDLTKITRAVANLSRASVSQKKLAAEVRQQTVTDAAAVAEKVAKASGMTAEAVEAIKRDILGIA